MEAARQLYPLFLWEERDMTLQRINEAEAILEPFWDGGTSEPVDPDSRFGVLMEYELHCEERYGAQIRQGWSSVVFSADAAQPGERAAVMRRSCGIALDGFDEFIVFAGIPETLAVNIMADIDGNTVALAENLRGKGCVAEYHLPIAGARLLGLVVEFIPHAKSVDADLCWFGLANRERAGMMESRAPVFGPEWQGFFAGEPELAPQTGLLFGREQLAPLRQKLKSAPYAAYYGQLKQQAGAYMGILPERYIGRYIHNPDRRWCRDRDMDEVKIPAVMECLAFVGLIEGDRAMLRMACRHALSASCCEHWCESEMGLLPGTTWHHRSFTEGLYCRACALVMDWAGGLLTPHAKQLVWDAMAMKGLPRIESDFHKIEYIREMNQGVVFSAGRVFAYLSLAGRYPRYQSNAAQAERDLLSMLETYIQADGGTLEGPSYALYTLFEALPALYMLAKADGGLKKYAGLLEKTGDFILSMLSLEKGRTTMIPINDCHPGTAAQSALAACFYQMTGDGRWQRLYWRLLDAGKLGTDTFSLILDMPGMEKAEYVHLYGHLPENVFFRQTGQLNTLRGGEDLLVNLHYCTGAVYAGHFNGDKGSFILEAEDQILCPDPGMCHYHMSNMRFLKSAEAHSLMLPILPGGRPAAQPVTAKGGAVLQAEASGDAVQLSGDETGAWEAGAVQSITRRIVSPVPELLLVIDKIAPDRAEMAQFNLNTYGTFAIQGGGATAQLGGISLAVLPLNWRPGQAAVADFPDGDGRGIQQLQLRAGLKKGGNLFITALCLHRRLAFRVEAAGGGWRISRDGGAWLVSVENDEAIVKEVD